MLLRFPLYTLFDACLDSILVFCSHLFACLLEEVIFVEFGFCKVKTTVWRSYKAYRVLFLQIILMSPPLLGVAEEEGQSNVTLLSSLTSAESICQAAMELKERNYMGLSDCSSVDSSVVVSDENKTRLNLKATELRLGLPGSLSPERNQELSLLSSNQLDEKPFFPLHPSNDGHFSTQKNVVSGSKRGFSDAMDGFSEGEFFSNSEANVIFSPRSAKLGLKPGSMLENLGTRALKAVETGSSKMEQEKPHVANKTRGHQNNPAKNTNGAPVAKAQVVGWPPVKSFRKNSLATTSKDNEEVDGKEGPGALFVKVSMDGAPYLRKVDLRNYSAYQELSSSLEKMFSCFTIGHYGSHGAPGREKLCESKLKDLLHCSEYVLTYEDKDGDWMLVGDVPWEMFMDTCKRLRITKGSDAIGLAPRAAENCKN